MYFKLGPSKGPFGAKVVGYCNTKIDIREVLLSTLCSKSSNKTDLFQQKACTTVLNASRASDTYIGDDIIILNLYPKNSPMACLPWELQRGKAENWVPCIYISLLKNLVE